MKVGAPALRLGFGLLLLLISGVALFLWFYWLAPLRNLSDPSWVLDHSPDRYWVELQKQLLRSGPSHDSYIRLGFWGDEKWVKWIMAKMQGGQEFKRCIDGHLDAALPYMTNQQPGPDAQSWLAWWSTNSHKTQLDWIREGFAKQSIELDQPLNTNNLFLLLTILTPATNWPASIKTLPKHRGALSHNACRWLRDSGFTPSQLSLSSVPADRRKIVTQGLVNYASWLGVFQDGPGKLQIIGVSTMESSATAHDPLIDPPSYPWLPYLAFLALAVGGVFLLPRAAKRGTRSAGNGVHPV